jgi:hypothetical protein
VLDAELEHVRPGAAHAQFGPRQFARGKLHRVAAGLGGELVDQAAGYLDDFPRDGLCIFGSKGLNGHRYGCFRRIEEYVDPLVPIFDESLQRNTGVKPRQEIGLWIVVNLAQRQPPLQLLDHFAAADIIGDDVGIGSYGGAGHAGHHPQHVGRLRVVAPHGEAGLRHILIGRENEEVEARHQARQQDAGQERDHQPRLALARALLIGFLVQPPHDVDDFVFFAFARHSHVGDSLAGRDHLWLARFGSDGGRRHHRLLRRHLGLL